MYYVVDEGLFGCFGVRIDSKVPVKIIEEGRLEDPAAEGDTKGRTGRAEECEGC